MMKNILPLFALLSLAASTSQAAGMFTCQGGLYDYANNISLSASITSDYGHPHSLHTFILGDDLVVNAGEYQKSDKANLNGGTFTIDEHADQCMSYSYSDHAVGYFFAISACPTGVDGVYYGDIYDASRRMEYPVTCKIIGSFN